MLYIKVISWPFLQLDSRLTFLNIYFFPWRKIFNLIHETCGALPLFPTLWLPKFRKYEAPKIPSFFITSIKPLYLTQSRQGKMSKYQWSCMLRRAPIPSDERVVGSKFSRPKLNLTNLLSPNIFLSAANSSSAPLNGAK